MNDPLQDPEEMREALRQMAAQLADYMDSLEAAGFSRGEALRLTIAYQGSLITGAQGGGE